VVPTHVGVNRQAQFALTSTFKWSPRTWG